MEFLLSLPMICGLLVFIYCLFFLIPILNRGNKKLPPQAAGAWPIIGHLHLLGGSQTPHIALASMAEKYGPIFTIKLGVYQTLIVSDSKIAKECYTTNDKAFAARPDALAVEVMAYGSASFDGPHWQQIRKIVMLGLLSNRRLEMLAHTRVSEIKSSIKDMYELWLHEKDNENLVKIEMKDWFRILIVKISVQMLVGKRYSSDDQEGLQFQKAIKTFVDLLGTFVVSDAIPYLKWLDLGGHGKVMRKKGKEMGDILDGWLQEHKRKRNAADQLAKGDQFEDFMYMMLDNVDDDEFPGFDADTIIKATCLGLLAGAIDTTTVTLTWALSLLLNNPHALKKVREELDLHIGKERQVQESDMKNLVYLSAVVKETLRLYPAGPLGVPHEAIEDCIVGGYDIPKGTRLFFNLYKLHRDPQFWSDPFEFQPERFLTNHKDIDVKGQNFELIPFGSGRRICPAMNFGFQAVHSILASLIHGFEFTTPSNEPVDMTESPGLTNLKATPLEVLVTPRLSPTLYA